MDSSCKYNFPFLRKVVAPDITWQKLRRQAMEEAFQEATETDS